jgi:hypothetical protein
MARTFVMVEKFELTNTGCGDARLAVHCFIEKEMISVVEKEMRDIPFVNKIEKEKAKPWCIDIGVCCE